MHEPLRAAVAGYGAYGRAHAAKYLAHPGVRLVAVADRDPQRRRIARRELPDAFVTDNMAALGERVDIASVVVPASAHHRIARELLDAGVHLLVEKPFTVSSTEARSLAALADARGLVLQPGYLERFNRTLQDLRARLPGPRYVEARRLTRWRGRGGDVSVVLDLMIHDIDMLLETIDSPIIDIQARGVRVVSDCWDVANAQLRFANGCIANLTASRASPLPERRLHVFTQRACALADIDAGRMLLYQRGPEPAGVMTEQCFQRDEDPLARELDAFVRAVHGRTRPAVDAQDGCRALAIAERIAASMEPDDRIVSRTAAPLTGSRHAIEFLLRNGPSLRG